MKRFIRSSGRTAPPVDLYPIDPWRLIETAYAPQYTGQTESVFSLANGYIGWRGNFLEGWPAVQSGTFINRFYESWPITYGEAAFGFASHGQTIVNVSDARIIKLYVDDDPFNLERARLADYKRVLDFQKGTLERSVIWETPGGHLVEVASTQMISFTHRHLCAISYKVKLLNRDAPLVIASEIRGSQHNASSEGDPRQARGLSHRVLLPDGKYTHDNRVILNHITSSSQMTISTGMDHVIETNCDYHFSSLADEEHGEVVFHVDAKQDEPIHLVKFITYHTSRTVEARELRTRAQRTLDRGLELGIDTLLQEQRDYLDNFWKRSDVQLEGEKEYYEGQPAEIQQALRWSLYQIIQSSARVDGAGLAAKGLSGQGYDGHYFWDTDIYVMPFLIYTNPQIAKNLISFRYRMLDKARERAREVNSRGALFPWRTINGEEASAYYAAGTAQYHINADIVFALRKYVNATGDYGLLYSDGAELLVETARLWADLGFYSDRREGKFCINGVTGPDEYNTVVNNNTYTNLMARENLRYAVETVEHMKKVLPAKYETLMRTTGLHEVEVEEWRSAAQKMYVPYDEERGIHLQDENFLERKPFDFEATPRSKYPLLLHHHPLVIYRAQVIKQADVVLAMFLLDREFSVEDKKRNFDYYDPLTTRDSSLSACIQSIVAADLGEQQLANDYGREALFMDLADLGGNVKDGCHIASMGGSWMVAIYGFAGMRDYDGVISFNPRLPKEMKRMSFPLTVRGQLLRVTLTQKTAEYTLEEGEQLSIEHQGKRVKLKGGESVRKKIL